MDKISKSYHERYAIVEYNQKLNQDQLTDTEAMKRAYPVMDLLWPDHLVLNTQTFKKGTANAEDIMDIYALSLRLSLTYGGNSHPMRILGTVYLKNTDRSKELEPLLREEASAIDATFKAMTPDAARVADTASEKTNEARENAASLHKFACNQLQKLITDNQSNLNATQTEENPHNFMNYLFLSDEEKEIIRMLLKKTAHNNTSLECSAIELLGISHVSWENTVFEYRENDACKLRFIFGLNKGLTVKCANCGETIVKNNNFLLQIYDGNELQYVERPLFLRQIPPMECEQMRKQLRLQHLLEISGCSRFDTGDSCHQVRCASQCFTAENGRLYCKDCSRPEIVCYDDALEPFLTAEGRFSISERKMIPKQKASRCPICNRYATNHDPEGGGSIEHCPLCREAISFARSTTPADEKSADCYRRYAHAVPLFARMRRARKAAFEDAGMVLIVIGEKIYKLDKLFSRTASVLPSAKRLLY